MRSTSARRTKPETSSWCIHTPNTNGQQPVPRGQEQYNHVHQHSATEQTTQRRAWAHARARQNDNSTLNMRMVRSRGACPTRAPPPLMQPQCRCIHKRGGTRTIPATWPACEVAATTPLPRTPPSTSHHSIRCGLCQQEGGVSNASDATAHVEGLSHHRSCTRPGQPAHTSLSTPRTPHTTWVRGGRCRGTRASTLSTRRRCTTCNGAARRSGMRMQRGRALSRGPRPTATPPQPVSTAGVWGGGEGEVAGGGPQPLAVALMPPPPPAPAVNRAVQRGAQAGVGLLLLLAR